VDFECDMEIIQERLRVSLTWLITTVPNNVSNHAYTQKKDPYNLLTVK
jgi:hypothetical protein